MLVFLLSLTLLAFVSSAKLPPNVKLCSKKDQNFLRCVEKNMMLAIKEFGPGSPDLGVPRLEPFFIEKLEIHGSQTGSVRLDQNYHNVSIYGFSISTISNLRIDHDKCRWEFDSVAPNIRMESDYALNGQLLVFPINGHGKSNVTMEIDIKGSSEIHTTWLIGTSVRKKIYGANRTRKPKKIIVSV
ncbi:unnamed protein product [Brassicogethes aeneus]|uniref:Uncharacterized protein n=1 Tax=Brassicogethes aeneus TaxID=1431903 RepID=A0A9P0FF91_BRAAE|nr:unnamed protein product [Brassicogethes aeneus]